MNKQEAGPNELSVNEDPVDYLSTKQKDLELQMKQKIVEMIQSTKIKFEEE